LGFELVTPVDDMVLTGEIVSPGNAVELTPVEGGVLIPDVAVSIGVVAGAGVVITVSYEQEETTIPIIRISEHSIKLKNRLIIIVYLLL